MQFFKNEFDITKKMCFLWQTVFIHTPNSQYRGKKDMVTLLAPQDRFSQRIRKAVDQNI